MLAEAAARGVRPNSVTLNTALKFLVHNPASLAPVASDSPPMPTGDDAAEPPPPPPPPALEAAAELVREMEGRGAAADVITFNTLLHLHATHGDMRSAPAGQTRTAAAGRAHRPPPAVARERGLVAETGRGSAGGRSRAAGSKRAKPGALSLKEKA